MALIRVTKLMPLWRCSLLIPVHQLTPAAGLEQVGKGLDWQIGAVLQRLEQGLRVGVVVAHTRGGCERGNAQGAASSPAWFRRAWVPLSDERSAVRALYPLALADVLQQRAGLFGTFPVIEPASPRFCG